MTSKTGGCLAGECADGTVCNAPGEVARVVAHLLPWGKKAHIGFYASGHSRLGAPTARWVVLKP